jgi:hypothetical protein
LSAGFCSSWVAISEFPLANDGAAAAAKPMPAEPTIALRVIVDFSDMTDAPWNTDNVFPAGSFLWENHNSG